MQLFDAHCHLQDPRVFNVSSLLIKTALCYGIQLMAINGVSEKDWLRVKGMSDDYPSVVPCFGLHPWFLGDRSPNWFRLLKEYFQSTPAAAVGEIGLHKWPNGTEADFQLQVQVFHQQIELAKEINRPASVHCVDAFDELLDIMESIGPFPAGVMLHSYMGSAELVPRLVKLGTYFSFSGHHTTFMTPEKLKAVLKAVPKNRILLESDAPDALPKLNSTEIQWVPGDASRTLNQPANIPVVLSYVASFLGMEEKEVAELTYRNSIRFYTYPGSKVAGDR
ncbi:hypothetical protein H6P81_008247 [Aristolochia fimbriata]|uniref:Uncharacterized protein n=1 Tax=Aristolochia fimbriata TaxID=158543 RepID=A0AAV7F708_ARIFI|nr:hypothetical protein H6P81_008247 [Aristolochia fimbriata]